MQPAIKKDLDSFTWNATCRFVSVCVRAHLMN